MQNASGLAMVEKPEVFQNAAGRIFGIAGESVLEEVAGRVAGTDIQDRKRKSRRGIEGRHEETRAKKPEPCGRAQYDVLSGLRHLPGKL